METLLSSAVLMEVKAKTQMAARVLRLCYSSQIVHLLRSVPPRSTQVAAGRLDDAVFGAMLRLAEMDYPSMTSPTGRAIRETRQHLLRDFYVSGDLMPATSDVAGRGKE